MIGYWGWLYTAFNCQYLILYVAKYSCQYYNYSLSHLYYSLRYYRLWVLQTSEWLLLLCVWAQCASGWTEKGRYVTKGFVWWGWVRVKTVFLSFTEGGEVNLKVGCHTHETSVLLVGLTLHSLTVEWIYLFEIWIVGLPRWDKSNFTYLELTLVKCACRLI